MTKRRTGKHASTRGERREHQRKNKENQGGHPDEITKAPIKPQKKVIRPLNNAQRRYDAAIKASDIVLGIGPAGTGKTWLAAMRAAEALEERRIERIIITRPAVTAEEDMGFLPGDLGEKYEPYLAPVKEALEERFGTGHLEYLLRKEIILPVPLGFMRGRTVKNCWLIGDEMQNATRGQTKMLLSRIGENAKMLINGDPRQLDIPRSVSGLEDANDRLRPNPRVSSIRFTNDDIVRSGLCQEIIAAYEN